MSFGLLLKGVAQFHMTDSGSMVVDSKGSLANQVEAGRVDFHLRGLLFSRTWGRETFFGGLSMERFEGIEGSTALLAKYGFGLLAKHPKPTGLPRTSALDNTEFTLFSLDKYAASSYYHFAGVFDFRFDR